MSAYAIIFDLEGVLADCSHRLHLLKDNDDPEWENFFEECDKDALIPAGAVLYNMLVSQALAINKAIKGNEIETDVPYVDIMTGRPEAYRDRTLAWLRLNGLLMPRNLHMRPKWDYRPDNILKLRMYDEFYRQRGEEVLAVFEDRKRVVDAWRAQGITCYQVADGDF